MSLTPDRDKSPRQDPKKELKTKTKELEDERAAQHEKSQPIIKNREHFHQLREENKILHKKLAEDKACSQSDEEIIQEVFRNRGSEINAFRNMTAREALEKVDRMVLFKEKQLNAMKRTNQTLQERVDKLKLEYELLSSEDSSGAVSSREEEEAMKLRALQNRLEKTWMKRKEAEKINAHYLKLKKVFQDESLTYEGQLDNLEAEILKQKEVLNNLQGTCKEAKLGQKASMTALCQQQEMSKEIKEKEQRLSKMWKQFLLEQADGKVQQTAIQSDELSSEDQHSATRLSDDKEETISTLEEAWRHIKDATGIKDVQDFVQRFYSQKKTYQYLKQRKTENEEILKQLSEQKELLEQEVEGMKYSRDTELLHEQKLLEESEHKLQATLQMCDEAKEHVDLHKKTLSTIRVGVKYLADQLQHVTLSEDRVAEVNPDSDEFVLELMKQCELKIQVLKTELKGIDLDVLRKQMEEDKEQFYDVLEDNLPKSSTRVKFVQDQTQYFLDDMDKSEEDEDVISRKALKRQSQSIIKANSKKASKKKKKGNF